jgi:hypothetical protein
MVFAGIETSTVLGSVASDKDAILIEDLLHKARIKLGEAEHLHLPPWRRRSRPRDRGSGGSSPRR